MTQTSTDMFCPIVMSQKPDREVRLIIYPESCWLEDMHCVVIDMSNTSSLMTYVH